MATIVNPFSDVVNDRRDENARLDPEPPYTNRGVDASHFQKSVFSFDWVRITIWQSMEYIKPFLSLLGADDGLEPTGHGGLGFKQLFQGLNGFQVYARPVDERYNFVSVNMPSKALHAIGMERFIAAYTWLCEQGLAGLRWNCTRLDLAFDTQEFAVEQFVEAYHSGEVKTRSSGWDERRSNTRKKGRGYTFYLGSRESTAFMRLYLKRDGSSYGDEPFTRVELEMKKERANGAFLEIMASPMAAWAKLAVRYINAFVECGHEWWQSWVASAAASWLKVRQAVPTVASIEKWLGVQVVASLTTYVSAVSQGDMDKIAEVVRGLLMDGKRKLSKKHEAMIRHYSPGDLPDFAVFAL